MAGAGNRLGHGWFVIESGDGSPQSKAPNRFCQPTGKNSPHAAVIRFMIPAMKRLLLLACMLLGSPLQAADLPALIPLPREVSPGDGVLALTSPCAVDAEVPTGAARLIDMLRGTGVTVAKADGKSPAMIRMRRGEVKNPYGFEGAYQLEVGQDGIGITAMDAAGFCYAAETLRQLVTKDDGKVTVPYVTIHDWPAFPVRGFMLDVGRNYQSPALLREQLEVMARYKLNVLHFHFTDNPGWRLESKLYPKLNDPASMSRLPGKYYTQAEFRELVGFCRERGITLIPEMDMPGHSEAFRKALGITTMNAPATRKILKDLLTEMAALAGPEDMPYIHLGTDEVRGAAEKVDATFLPEMAAHVRSLGREVIGWHKGLEDASDKKRITQLWAKATPLPNNPYIDSRSTYLNHMDPFDAVSCLFFQQSCRVAHGDAKARGGILCSWPDIRIANERDQLNLCCVYPGLLTFAESLWRGVATDDKEAYWANLPPPETAEFQRFRAFEQRLLDHKSRFFAGKEFPYVKQTDLRWRIIGPFPHGGDVTRKFPVEDQLNANYQIDNREYRWLERPFAAATVHLKHFFGFGAPVKEGEGTCYALTHIWSPDARELAVWIGFHSWSASDRRGGPSAAQGEWHPKQPWARVNGRLIAPPVWIHPSLAVASAEIPFTNENYQCREPSRVPLHQGWNEVLLKIPQRKSDWKWMFTFAPVGNTNGLRYSADLRP